MYSVEVEVIVVVMTVVWPSGYVAVYTLVEEITCSVYSGGGALVTGSAVEPVGYDHGTADEATGAIGVDDSSHVVDEETGSTGTEEGQASP